MMETGQQWDFSNFAIGCTTFIAICWMSAPIRFHLKVTLYHVYLIVAASFMCPFMMVRGRSRKHMVWCGWAMKVSEYLFGIQCDVINEGNIINNGPSVMISNHQSALDVIGMAKFFSERSTILAKKALLFAGPFGLATWLSGFIFIERSDHKGSKEVMDKVADEISDQGLCVWIFPEGTRNMKEEMLPFKKGAFNLAVKAQVPIVPVVFSSYKKFFYPDNHIFTRGKCVAEVLPPISTKGLTLEDVPKLSEKVRLQMMDTFKRISSKDY